jgi:hypothetical protein
MEFPAVLDYGSRWLKGGYAFAFPTDDEPRVALPSAVGVAAEDGEEELRRPVHLGKVLAWDEFEALVYNVLYNHLGWQHGSEGSLLICEPLLTSRPDRERMCQLMFETFNVANLLTQVSRHRCGAAAFASLLRHPSRGHHSGFVPALPWSSATMVRATPLPPPRRTRPRWRCTRSAALAAWSWMWVTTRST